MFEFKASLDYLRFTSFHSVSCFFLTLLFAFIIFPRFNYAQCGTNETLVFQELFTEGNGATSGSSDEGNGHAWNATLSSGPNNVAEASFFGVDDPFNNFECSNSTGEWETDPIDISCYQSVSFEINCLKFGADPLDAEDLIEVFYSTNGGGSFTQSLSGSTGFSGQLVSESGLMGTDLVLRVTFSTNDASEILAIDDIIVCGVKTTPTFNDTPGPYCVGQTAPPLPSSSDDVPAIPGSWSPASVNTSSEGTTTHTFIPDDTDCYNTIDMDITVSAGPMANDAGPLFACLRIDGTGQFNLTLVDNDVNGGTGLPVTYYEDAGATMPIGDPTNFVYNFGMPPGFPIILPSLNGTVYARVDDNGCLSNIATIELEATIGAATSLDPNPLFICLDPVTRMGDVELDPYNSQIITSGGEVQWFGWEGLPNLPFFIGTGGTYTLDPPATLYGVYIDGNDCIYFPSTVDVNGHPIPDSNTPTGMSSCADENGEATFDLTMRDIEVGTGNILWFEDMDLTTQISDPMMYVVINGSDQIEITTIYAVNQDPVTMCLSETVSMELVVYPYPMWNPIGPFELCSTPGTNSLLIDLTENDEAIVGLDGRVEWFLDDLATNPVVTPTMVNLMAPGNTYYAQVYGPEPGNCLGPIVEVEFILNLSPLANEPDEKEICVDPDLTTVIIDLTQYNDEIYIGGQISWFTDMGLTNLIPNPEEYMATRTLTEVYARVEENGCFSNTVVLRFVELEQPEANDASIDGCDDGSGFATFDLTTINNLVNGGSGLPVIYYEEFDGEFLSSIIGDPDNYYTDRTTIFAVVDNGDCISNVVTITLNILNNAELLDISPISVCADENGQARINLLSYEADMLDGQPGTITWFLEDQVTLVQFPDSVIITGDSIFVAQAGSGTSCASDPVSILFTLSNGINHSTPNNPYLLCPDPTTGLALIDLESFIDSIYNGTGTGVWTETNGDTIDLTMDYFSTLPTTLNLYLTEGLCESGMIVFEFEERPSFRINDASLTACDDGSGNALFDLTLAENDIFNDPNASFTYYQDLTLTNIINSPGNYSSTGGSVYVIVEIDACSAGPAELVLNVISSAQACPSSLDTCGMNGMITLNLLNFNNEVNCGMGTSVFVTWYDDPLATSEITAPSNYTTGGGSVWFIVGTGICASDTLEFPITINPQPSSFPDTLESCDDGNGMGIFDLTQANNVVNGGTGSSVSWFENINLTNAIVNQANYSASDQTIVYATVTANGCVSEPAEILLTIIDEPSFMVPSIDTCGDANGSITLDLTQYDDIINSSGQVNWYIDMNGNIPIGDPTNFFTVSATIYAQVDINGCLSPLTPVPLVIRACSCTTQAAELIPSMVDVCLPDNLIMDTIPGTLVLEPGDEWQFVLHDGDANNLGNILDRNNTGVFLYNPTYNLGDTYYVHVIAGPLDGSNNIDVNDDCFDISDTGIPVRFFEPATVDSEPLYFEICEGDVLTIDLEFNLAGYSYSFDLFNSTTGANQSIFTGILMDRNFQLILNNPDAGRYELRNIQYIGVDCMDPNFTKEIIIDVITVVQASESSITCDSTNNFYIVEILLTGGNDPTDYIISPLSTHTGSFVNDSIFRSDPIPVDEQSIFGFSGICGGGTSSIQVPPQDCSELCATDAGSIELDTSMACTADFFTISEMDNILDNDDVVYFVIHDDPDLFASGFRIVQTTREIFYDPSLVIGQTYYVTMVVGNGDPNGVFDINDPCLDISNTMSIMFLPNVQVDLFIVDNSICLGDSVALSFGISGTLRMDIQLQGPDGIVNLTDVGNNDVFNFYSERSGEWEIIDILTPTNCLEIGDAQEVNISNLSAGLDILTDFDGYEISCGGLNDGAIRVLPMNGVEPYVYQWSDGATGFERSNLFAGTYTVSVTDAGGCIDSAQVTLTEPTPIQLIASASDPECFGGENGSIFIEDVQGGSGVDYRAALNGFVLETINPDSLPYEIENLGSNFYEVGIFDSNNCYSSVDIELASPPSRTININRNALPGDSIVNLGETVQLEVQSPFDFDSIQWETEFDFDCVNPPVCDIIRIAPLRDGFINVSAIDEDGCPATASIFISVNTERRVFAPGSFSPNADGNNDFFTLYSTQIANINRMEVYDRWGNQVWLNENFQANIENLGWDGTYRGEELDPAVFVWLAEIELIDNTTRIFRGDVSLIR